jgi:hypothetical protein
MKKCLFTAILVLPFWCSAQSVSEVPLPRDEKIRIGIGQSVGYNNKSGGFLRTTPYAQYALDHKWAFRLEGRYDFYGPSSNDVDMYLGAGLFTRYQFIDTKKWSLYGQVGYFYGVRPSTTYEKVALGPAIDGFERNTVYPAQGMLSLGAGAERKISPRWSINARVEKNFNQNRNAGWNGTIGVDFKIK